MITKEHVALMEAVEVFEARRDYVDFGQCNPDCILRTAKQMDMLAVLHTILTAEEEPYEHFPNEKIPMVVAAYERQLKWLEKALELMLDCQDKLFTSGIDCLDSGDQAFTRLLGYRVITFERAEFLVEPDNLARARSIIDTKRACVVDNVDGMDISFRECKTVDSDMCVSYGILALRLCKRVAANPDDLRSVAIFYFLMMDYIQDLELIRVLAASMHLLTEFDRMLRIASHYLPTFWMDFEISRYLS